LILQNLLSKKTLFLFILIFIVVVACSNDTNEKSKESEDSYPVPSTEDLDDDNPLTEYIKYGEEVIEETNVVLPEKVGNELSCQSCHADGGTTGTLSLQGVASQYPDYRPREDTAFTLEDRINGCFIRSLNGEMLDEDSKEMRSMISYLTYISEGVEIKGERPWFVETDLEEIPKPDITEGEELYEEKNCLTCHGEDGSGTGSGEGPALWGDGSFNDGAGMGRLKKAAGFIHKDMPKGEEGTLSEQEAADLAAFILSQDRPIFKDADKDWPNGDAPSDTITQERRDQMQKGEFDWLEEINDIKPRE